MAWLAVGGDVMVGSWQRCRGWQLAEMSWLAVGRVGEVSSLRGWQLAELVWFAVGVVGRYREVGIVGYD